MFFDKLCNYLNLRYRETDGYKDYHSKKLYTQNGVDWIVFTKCCTNYKLDPDGNGTDVNVTWNEITRRMTKNIAGFLLVCARFNSSGSMMIRTKFLPTKNY